MKTALPWLLVVVLLGGVYFLFTQGKAKDAELAQLRQQGEEFANLRAENAELRKIENQSTELERLKKENADMPRLRNEVRQMREQAQELAKKLAASQAQSADAAQTQQQLNQLTGENEALRTHSQQVQQDAAQVMVRIRINQCIANLRLLDTAKQQWAIETRRSTGSVPTVADLLPYLPQNLFPICPGGGIYTLNAVDTLPTCSIPVHALK